jgi:Lon protease-like protein
MVGAMATSPIFRCVEDLPTVIPIFPLPAVLLLPRGKLPLNIFEPRYLEMTEDALAGSRVIGMIQPIDPTAPMAHPAVYRTGCAGRITTFSETDDGRYLITLSGLARFDVVDELPMGNKRHRRVRVSYDRFAGDLGEPAEAKLDRARLMPALKGYFAKQGLTADWQTIERTPENHLITCLSMICPFNANEKQALLECVDDAARGDTMLSLLEMAVHEGRCGCPSDRPQ